MSRSASSDATSAAAERDEEPQADPRARRDQREREHDERAPPDVGDARLHVEQALPPQLSRKVSAWTFHDRCIGRYAGSFEVRQAIATAPPRRGSPPPDSAPVADRAAPPARRRRTGCGPRSARARARQPPDPRCPRPARRTRRPSSKCTRGASIASWIAEPAVEHPDHDLQDRRADPVRAGRAEHEPRVRRPSEHHRRRHHRRQPAARRMRVEAERREVLLAHHVVEVDAGARHDLAAALAVRARHRARPAVGVGGRDVRRAAQPARGEALEEPGLRQAGEELRRALGLRRLHRVDDRGDRRRRRRRGRAARARRRAGSRRRSAAGSSARSRRGRRRAPARARPSRRPRGRRASSSPPRSATQSQTAAAMSPV